MRRTLVLVAVALIAVTALPKSRAIRTGPPKPIVATRSIEVTDKAIVAAFPLERVLAQLIARSGVTGLTPQQLVRQLYDTQNPRPGLADPAGPHCDDTLVGGTPSFNGFPRRCPTPEAQLAATPYVEGEYFTLGVVNRFDLTPPDGANCGQYRLVFAHRETELLDRLHFIFEAVLPSPNPSAGLAACRPVAQFWADISAVDSMDERRARLERFFFDGLPGFAPVIDPANFRAAGGIRTLQQKQGNNRFYQFRLVKDCASGDCTLRFMPDVLENMPFGRLFDGNHDTPIARQFRAEFVKHVATLAIKDLNLFRMQIPSEYLMAESNPLPTEPAFAYTTAFDRGATTPAGVAFRNAMQAELTRIGSTLTIQQLLQRAEHQSCFGCHGFNGIPLGEGVKLELGFFSNQMISEDTLSDGEGGPQSRYGVDPIIEKQFIPHRIQIIEDFLRNGTPPVHSN